MKTKILILLPIVFILGLLLGHVMLVLATITVPNPGHPASQIGAGAFADAGDYYFKSGARVGIGTYPSLTFDVDGDVRVRGNRISFTGQDGTGFSWIKRSINDDTNLLIGWDSKGNTRIPSDKSLITSDQTCPTGWNCGIKTWDIAAQSGQFYGDLKVNGKIFGSLGQERCEWITGSLGAETFCPTGYYMFGSQTTLSFTAIIPIIGLPIPTGIIQKIYCCKP